MPNSDHETDHLIMIMSTVPMLASSFVTYRCSSSASLGLTDFIRGNLFFFHLMAINITTQIL